MTLDKRLAQTAQFLIRLINSPLPGNQLQTLADFAPQILPTDYLAVAFIDTEPAQYLLYSLIGQAGAALPNRPFPLATGLIGQAMGQRAIQYCRDLANEPAACPEIEGVLARFGLQSLLVLPLVQADEAIGALLCGSKQADAYQSEERQIAQLLASGLAEGLESARQYQRFADEHSMLEAVLRSSKDAVLLTNLAGVVLMANPAVSTMLGLSESELIGQPLQAAGNKAIAHLFQENRSGVLEVALPDGRTAQAQLMPVRTAFSEHVGWAAILRDITVLKELEQMKSDFVNTVSHDLKNPITSFVLGANLLGAAGPLNEKQKEVQGRLINTADYMQQLVSDLLDLGKIEAGLNLKMAETDLAELVQKALAPLQAQVDAKQQQLVCELPPSAPLRGDASWLRHVLTNLISNASKYTPAAGRIIIRLQNATGGSEAPDSRLALRGYVFSVQDNGVGIPAADLPHVFDKFFRSQTEATATISGTGLGLAMARSIIQAHDGYIWAESTEGTGSTFSFYLPVPAAASTDSVE